MTRNLSIKDSCTGLYLTDDMLAVEVLMQPAAPDERVATVILDCADMENLIQHFISVLADKKAGGTYKRRYEHKSGGYVYAKEFPVSAAPVAVKHDNGKPSFDLLPWEALEQVAAVMGYGATKYGAHNWRLGMEWGRLFAACLRHMSAYWRGEDHDKESGLPHLAHAAACLLMLLASVITGAGKDDRRG